MGWSYDPGPPRARKYLAVFYRVHMNNDKLINLLLNSILAEYMSVGQNRWLVNHLFFIHKVIGLTN